MGHTPRTESDVNDFHSSASAPRRRESDRRLLGWLRSSNPAALAPLLLVSVAVVFNAWTLRAELTPVQNLNDSSVHSSMVRWADYRVENGYLPLDGWYPYLSLGSSRFHHYQSLPHILTGYLSGAFGDRTFLWIQYLLLSFWPVAVYVGARLLDLERTAAGVAALLSPLLLSIPGLGYEYDSYVWRGSGMWAQLWGMWALPFALAIPWRAVSRGRGYAVAALAIGVALPLHLMTGYLALLALGVWVLIVPTQIFRRSIRALVIGAGALLIAAWLLVPLVQDAKWTTHDEYSSGTYFYDSFGARRILGWLFTGGIFDGTRTIPVVSVLVGVGLVVCVLRARSEEPMRVIMGFGLLSLLLFFGRPTLGPVIDLLPGGGDIFLRRYVFGVHLAGLLIAGVGVARVGRWIVESVRTRADQVAPVIAVAALLIAVLMPAWSERYRYHREGADRIELQAAAERAEGGDIELLLAEAQRLAGGRVYAGMRGGWGDDYRLGFVPMYAVLLNHDVDAIGFTRPTWSLVSNVEARFDDGDPAQYDLFNIRYLLLPSDRQPEIPQAELVETAGRHTLWRVPTSGYIEVVDTIAPISADRTNLARNMAPFLDSSLPAEGLYPTVAFGGEPAAPPTLGSSEDPPGPAGEVLETLDAPADGTFAARVRADRTAFVMLKASFDPRWSVTVDGVPVDPQMVAPGFVGRTVAAGDHLVAFRYEQYPNYLMLFVIGGLGLLGLAAVPRLSRRRRRRSGARGVAHAKVGEET